MTFRALIPFFIALGAVALMFLSFVTGINAALDAGGSGSLFWQVVFILSAILLIATLVLSIVKIVKKRDVVISVATLFVGVLPLVVVIILVVSATQVATR